MFSEIVKNTKKTRKKTGIEIKQSKIPVFSLFYKHLTKFYFTLEILEPENITFLLFFGSKVVQKLKICCLLLFSNHCRLSTQKGEILW